MTTLTGKKPKNTYKDLLQVSNSNAGIDSASRAIEDGEGTASTLLLSSSKTELAGPLDCDAEELVLDADGDTSITADTDDQIDIRIGGADLFRLVAAGAAGDKTWQLIETQSASASSALDFETGIDSVHDLYAFVLMDLVPATDSAALLLRTSGDGGSTYDAGATDYSYHAAVLSAAASSYGGISSTGAAAVQLNAGTGNAAGESYSGILFLLNPSSATYTKITGLLVSDDDGGEVQGSLPFARRDAAAAVDAIRFLMSSGNIATGTIALYALKK